MYCICTVCLGAHHIILLPLSLQLYQLSWTCCLLDPQFVQYCCEFYVTQAVWITRLLESCKQVHLRTVHTCIIVFITA